MSETSGRDFAGHMAIALTQHCRELRRDGLPVPEVLELLAALYTDCVRTRQNGPQFAQPLHEGHSAGMDTLLLLTKRETAGQLCQSVRQVERHIASGRLTAVKVGAAVRVRRADLDSAWIWRVRLQS